MMTLQANCFRKTVHHIEIEITPHVGGGIRAIALTQLQKASHKLTGGNNGVKFTQIIKISIARYQPISFACNQRGQQKLSLGSAGTQASTPSTDTTLASNRSSATNREIVSSPQLSRFLIFGQLTLVRFLPALAQIQPNQNCVCAKQKEFFRACFQGS